MPPGELVDIAHSGFTAGDVAEITWIDEGENDGPSWIIGGRLHDGRWFFLSAGCDYTGWDCRAGGSAWVAATRADIAAFAMGDDDRRRLGVELA